MDNTCKNNKIPNAVKKIIQTIEKNGACAYIVGGYIRDSIREADLQNSDIDIATNATPNEVEQMFGCSEWATYPLGIKFGTIALIQNDTKRTYEITTFRTEEAYTDGRHPDSVSFANTIEEDLSRRDFTCNAIACDAKGNIVDPFNGIEDVHNNVIRAVGNPKERFEEDHLRILRALRFASQLGFVIEDDTALAIREMKGTINTVSSERIREELTKLLCGTNAKEILTLYSDVIFEIIPELAPLYNYDQKTKYHSYDAWTHTLIVVDKTKSDPIARWAALLHDIGKPDCFTMDEEGQGHFYGHPVRSVELAKPILQRLHFSKKTMDSILLLVRWHDKPMAATKKSVRRVLRLFSEVKTIYNLEQMFRIFCDLRRADSYAHAENYREYLTFMDEVEAVFDELLAENEAFALRDLAISGKDVMDLGIPQGPKISEALNACLDAVINEEIPNEKQKLLDYIEKNIN